MRWPWQTQRPEKPQEIDYTRCASCGGTGWAYAINADSSGNILPGAGLQYIPCPGCRYGDKHRERGYAT